MNEDLIEVFVEEAMELLGGLEDHLLVLENDPTNNAALNAAFRALHSIKGSAAMFGFDAVGQFAHKVETLLDLCRAGRVPVTAEVADLVLQSRDHLKQAIENPASIDPAREKVLTDQLDVASGAIEEPKSPLVSPASPLGHERTYLIKFAPSANTYQRGVRPERLIEEVRALGRTSVLCHAGQLPSLHKLDVETCHLSWDIMVSTREPLSALQDIFLFEEGTSSLSIEEIDHGELVEDGQVKKLGEILDANLVDPEAIEAALHKQRRLGEILVDDFHAPAEHVEEALFKQEHVRAEEQSSREDFERKSLRVHRDKLDGLVNLVGELVTVQAQLSQAVKSIDDRHVIGITDYIKRLIGELRATSMMLRMVPLDSLQPKFKRLVRDLSKTLGKDLEIDLEGGKTEIDKSVIDALTDPLMHLIRNACDHGIEGPEERRKKGKPAKGTIQLSAVHAGSFVRLTIRDDGAGLDYERIRSRAVERGLVPADARLTQEEISGLIFAPGFSTAAQISAVSGRGVGLDVVKTAIEQLGGTVQIQSERGRGSQFILNIPLTMAIIDGFLARSGRQMMIIPLASVHSCFERQRPEVNEHMLVNAGEVLPYLSMRDFFVIAEPPSEREEVVIVSILESKLALGFDQILGGFQTVIKSIGELAREMPGLSGSAILPDGGIALILDIAALTQRLSRG